jgi:hypothetical protein
VSAGMKLKEAAIDTCVQACVCVFVCAWITSKKLGQALAREQEPSFDYQSDISAQ